MARSKHIPKENPPEQAQVYDTTFKDWIHSAAPQAIPFLLPGSTYEGELNVEHTRPSIRADKVFNVNNQGDDSILHIEFETGADNHMASRMHAYNAVLHHDYQKPVISLIIYPFRTTMAISPLDVSSAKKNIVTFHFEILPLFKLEAEEILHQHLVAFYPLLPTMHGANRKLIKLALEELASLYC
ncbi:MAG TPA: hypothetical protein VKR42_10045, partial [Ktedonobacteraceae bacterium]|nr:hypothetical protein [Ktedonobacteraceae bacterium]